MPLKSNFGKTEIPDGEATDEAENGKQKDYLEDVEKGRKNLARVLTILYREKERKSIRLLHIVSSTNAI